MALKIIIAIAIAVTSIPVISRIFIELNVMNTRFAKIVLAAATIHDVILWVALAIASGLVKQEEYSAMTIVPTIFTTILFFLVSLLVMPQIIRFITNSRLNLLFKSSNDAYVLFLCLVFAVVANIFDINVVFGAFLAGFILGTMQNEKFVIVKTNIKRFSLAFFIPIYFAVVGLRINLMSNFDAVLFSSFLLFSSFFQIGGTFSAARATKLGNLSSFNLAVAMNTRGGPGIVLATVAFDIGIINEAFFVSLIAIAIITSVFAGFWFKFILQKGYPLIE